MCCPSPHRCSKQQQQKQKQQQKHTHNNPQTTVTVSPVRAAPHLRALRLVDSLIGTNSRPDLEHHSLYRFKVRARSKAVLAAYLTQTAVPLQDSLGQHRLSRIGRVHVDGQHSRL
eukprot:4285897-Amphidinium_carterae.1